MALVHPYTLADVRRGGERYLDDLTRYLLDAGHAVEVITGTSGPSHTAMEGGATLRLRQHRLPAPLARRGVSRVDAFGVAALPVLVRHRFDVVHALTPTGALAGVAAGQRTLYTVLGHPTPDQYGRRPLDRRLAAAAARRSSRTVAFSAASAAQVEAMFGRPTGVLPPGVRVDRFTPDLRPRVGPPRVLLPADVGDPRKGAGLLLSALGRLLDVHPDARVQVSGDGDQLRVLERAAGPGAAVLGAVDALGPAGDGMPARYRAATVTVLPSRHEAFGIALIESLACGTPVVCTADGGMAGIVDDPAVGLTVPADDPAALAQALDSAIELARRPETPARCAAHALRWEWRSVVGPAHESAYRRLLRRP